MSTLDDAMRSLGHDRIDVFKMDIEGGEWDILPQIIDAPEGAVRRGLVRLGDDGYGVPATLEIFLTCTLVDHTGFRLPPERGHR